MTDIPAHDNHQAAEAAARVRQAGALPARVSTLAYIPAAQRDQYERGFDGEFYLSYVHQDDAINTTAHLDAIASGALEVLPAGETRASVDAARAAAEQMNTDMLAHLGELEAKDLQRRKDALNAQREKLAARHAQELAALEKRYAPGFVKSR